MKKQLDTVTVLGAGIMGSRIACHLAGTGHQVILLDMASPGENKNKLVETALNKTLKSKPEALFSKNFRNRIKIGNFDDDFNLIRESDWIIEVVSEKLEIKKAIYEKVDASRQKGSLVTSNTSGIPIHMMSEGRSEDFQQHFFGTHFFNPPRYLELLEVIPGPKTKQEVLDFFMSYGFKKLGKQTVLCKDTPGFVGNRIGVYAMLSCVKAGLKMKLSFGEIDDLTGKIIGRAKSATFRTADIVGIDTLINLSNNFSRMLNQDESVSMFSLPPIISFLEEKKWFGDKSGQGFYKKEKDKDGNSIIFELSVETKTYQPKTKASFESIKKIKESGKELNENLRTLFGLNDKVGDFYRYVFSDLFRYASLRIPEISNSIYSIDQSMCSGFNWKQGPFEIWDILGIENVLRTMEALNLKPASWVYDMVKNGIKAFYKTENGTRMYYNIKSGAYEKIPFATKNLVILSNIRSKTVWENDGASLLDIGDDVACLEIHTKMNSIGGEVLQAIHKCTEIVEKSFRGMVIGSEADNFSAGANLSILYMYASQQEFDEINLMIDQFQKATLRLRYSRVPIVAATSGLALGGGCEIAIHCAAIQAHVETYIGLVETGVGLIPAGGGTKESAKWISDRYQKGDVEINTLEKYFKQIALAQVATSAFNAIEMGYVQQRDAITFNRKKLLFDAKQKVLSLSTTYQKPLSPLIKVLGSTGYSVIEIAISNMLFGRHISQHDALIAKKLGYVICGGDLTQSQEVTEQYLLDLEREAFLSLCTERKTLERIHSILFKRKPLRN